ncbi:unnamed protein product, partial [Darwinula stevensoni]
MGGTWKWSDGTDLLETLWTPPAPGSLEAEREHCLAFMRKSTWDKGWFPRTCYISLPFVCQLPTGLNDSDIKDPEFPKEEKCDGELDEWYKYGDSCYYYASKFGDSGEIPENEVSWFHAVDACRGKGGDLVSFHGVDEVGFVVSVLTRYYRDDRMWAGLTGHGLAEDEYRWSDMTLVDFFYWSSGEPNDHEDQESCISFFPDNGYWNDDHCALPRGYVCEKCLGNCHPTEPPPPPLPDHCRPGWTFYEGRCYKLWTEKKTWGDARSTCRNESPYTDLVSIHSIEEDTLVASMSNTSEVIWLGLHKSLSAADNEWIWCDETIVNFTAWDSNKTRTTRNSV